MTTNQTMATVDLSKLNGGSHGPALSPNKRKPVAKVEAVDYKPKAVVGAAASKAEAKRNNMLKDAKGPKLKPEPIAEPEASGKLSDEFREGDDDLEAAQEAEAKPEFIDITDEELKTALDIIARASKQKAEAIRKAAAERKKVAPAGEKVKPVKELTQAQKDKLAKAEKAAETYSVVASAAMGLAGKGLAESTKMQTALSFVPLPALRWLAKQYEGIAIPKDKRSAADIREFLRIELLTWKAPEAKKPIGSAFIA